MKMILELGTMEAKNAVTSGALLGMLEVMADFEKENEAPARGFAEAMKQPAAQAPIQQPTAPVQQPAAPAQTTVIPPMPQPQQTVYQQAPVQAAPVQQPIYPSSMPGTFTNPQPPTGPVQQQMQPQQPQAMGQQPQQAVVPTSQAPAYNMEQLAVAATQLVDAGRMNELRGILSSFGVTALTELPKERYGEFATILRQNGVKI